MNTVTQRGIKLILRCLAGIFVSICLTAILGVILLSYPKIFSAITTVVFLGLLYTSAWDAGYTDKFGQTGIKPSFKRAFLIAQFPAFTGYLSLIISLIPSMKITGKTIFKIWFFAYSKFYSEVPTYPEMIICILSVPLWVIASYYIGTTGFSILDNYGKRKAKREIEQKEALERKKEERRQMRKQLMENQNKNN